MVPPPSFFLSFLGIGTQRIPQIGSWCILCIFSSKRDPRSKNMYEVSIIGNLREEYMCRGECFLEMLQYVPFTSFCVIVWSPRFSKKKRKPLLLDVVNGRRWRAMGKCRRKVSEIGTRLQSRCEWGLRPPLRHGPRQLVLFAESMATIHPYCVGKTAVAEDLRFNSIRAKVNKITTYVLHARQRFLLSIHHDYGSTRGGTRKTDKRGPS